MPTTALILRPANAKPVHVLECDGPNPAVDPIINYTPGTYLPMLSFEEWQNQPDHIKNSRYSDPSTQDYISARRIGRLLIEGRRTGQLSNRHMVEILARLELLHPDSCIGSNLTKALTA